MRDLVTLLIMAAFIAPEVLLWTRNPMQVPATFLPARTCGFQLFQELDHSMEPAVHEGRHVLVSSWPYWNNEPKVGDVIAFAYPPDPASADLKRIVAVGGTSIEIRSGVIYVDDRPSPAIYPHRAPAPAGDLPKIGIPPGSFFVMGDNPDQSEDSRRYGVIARERIIGRQWP